MNNTENASQSLAEKLTQFADALQAAADEQSMQFNVAQRHRAIQLIEGAMTVTPEGRQSATNTDTTPSNEPAPHQHAALRAARAMANYDTKLHLTLSQNPFVNTELRFAYGSEKSFLATSLPVTSPDIAPRVEHPYTKGRASSVDHTSSVIDQDGIAAIHERTANPYQFGRSSAGESMALGLAEQTVSDNNAPPANIGSTRRISR